MNLPGCIVVYATSFGVGELFMLVPLGTSGSTSQDSDSDREFVAIWMCPKIGVPPNHPF